LIRIRVAKSAHSSIDRFIRRTLISLDHCARTPPPFRPEAPLQR